MGYGTLVSLVFHNLPSLYPSSFCRNDFLYLYVNGQNLYGRSLWCPNEDSGHSALFLVDTLAKLQWNPSKARAIFYACAAIMTATLFRLPLFVGSVTGSVVLVLSWVPFCRRFCLHNGFKAVLVAGGLPSVRGAEQ